MTDKQPTHPPPLHHEAAAPRRERELLTAIDELSAKVERLREALRSITREEDPKAMKAIAEREAQ